MQIEEEVGILIKVKANSKTLHCVFDNNFKSSENETQCVYVRHKHKVTVIHLNKTLCILGSAPVKYGLYCNNFFHNLNNTWNKSSNSFFHVNLEITIGLFHALVMK